METTNISIENKQAMERIAEINDLFGEIYRWSVNDADATIKQLYADWQTLLSIKENAISKNNINKCSKLIERCISFRENVVEKRQYFSKNVIDKIPSIIKLAEDNKDIKSLLEDVVGLWNNFGQPQLEILFDKAVELETSIRGIMEIVMEPVEIVKEEIE